MTKRVAVIGAGPAGLATTKELLDEGHDPTCFERAGAIGGVFRVSETDGVVWPSLRLVSSGVLTAFSDFPVSASETGHMPVGVYAAYLNRYAHAFGVTNRIRFHTSVESVRPASGGGWTIRTLDAEGRRREETFDAVAVCAGQNQNASIPCVTGQDTFTGTILHASQYRQPGLAAGRRVLVVGGGESAADIVAEVSRVASETVLSLRRGVAVVPRIRRGVPNDYAVCRLNHSAAHWVAHTHHPDDEWKRRVYRIACFPAVLYERGARAITSLVETLSPMFGRGAPVGWRLRLAEVRARTATRRATRQLLAESGGQVMEQFGTKSEGFATAIAEGRCRRVGAIDRFEGAPVFFEDGQTFEPDVVIYCTGFHTRVPFVDAAIGQAARYLHTFVPEVGPSLAFIGFVRPAHGAVPPLAELQARWFAQVVSGARPLPAEPEMRTTMARIAGVRRHYFRAVRGRLDQLVDFTSFCDELAAQVGCKPSREQIRRERRRFRVRFLAAPFASAQYRLVGPHAKPELARSVITELPIGHPPLMLAAIYLRWLSTRVLNRLFGQEFAPKLRV